MMIVDFWIQTQQFTSQAAHKLVSIAGKVRLQDIYVERVENKAWMILNFPDHPLHLEFKLLPSAFQNTL